MLPRRPRCTACPPPEKYRLTERCRRKHPTYSKCSGCGLTDENKHYCDYIVGRAMGISTDFGYCDRSAKEQREYKRHDSETETRWGWLCAVHTPEAKAAREAKSEARHQAHRERWRQQDKEAKDRDDAFDIVAEMARWIAKNRDLAEEDEWLGQIAERMAGNDAIQQQLERGDE